MTASARLSLPVLALLSGLSTATLAVTAQYIVDGIALGSRVAFNSQNYRSYTCNPSADFTDLTWCQRSQQQNIKGRKVIVSSTILHAPDGTAHYLMLNVAPAMLSESAINNEIAQLSQELRGRPEKVEWFTLFQNAGPKSVIAYWGQVKLEQVFGEELKIIAAGQSPRLGVLVDTLGDLARSAKDYNFPVYRIAGGPGYLYAASFDANGHGHRHYVAIDSSQLLDKAYEPALEAILIKDRNLASNDYSLWPDLAALTRRFSLETSPRRANEVLDKVFSKLPSKKLRSHVWSILPGGTITHLRMHQHGTIDIYGPKTNHPIIRSTIQRFLAANPSEPFAEFLYYTIAEYDKALAANPNSPISDVLNYAAGYEKLGSLAREAASRLNLLEPNAYNRDDIFYSIAVLNRYSERSDYRALNEVVPNFDARAAAARANFEAVMRNGSVRHADDAAYMLGWLAFHQGKPKDALPYFGRAMVLGNTDYLGTAVRQTLRIQRQHSPREQAAMVEADRNLSRQPILWYVAARAAYRELDYALTIDTTQRALEAMDIPVDRLPATTDPASIINAIEKIRPELRGDYDMQEIPYLLEASREILRYLNSLNSVTTERPDAFTGRARTIIIKYSKLVDDPYDPNQRRAPTELGHRDLRQALHMIDKTFESMPKTAQYARLREWLYYRKIRVLVAFAPNNVADEVAAMEREFPTSALLDDVLAEQIFTQGMRLHDLNAAEMTFRKLVSAYPRGNAIDNAYTWMAIIYRCQGRVQEAQNMNREIIRRFPMTRHAMYAQERLANPTSCNFADR